MKSASARIPSARTKSAWPRRPTWAWSIRPSPPMARNLKRTTMVSTGSSFTSSAMNGGATSSPAPTGATCGCTRASSPTWRRSTPSRSRARPPITNTSNASARLRPRMAYPDPRMERVSDGRQCRFATTEDFRHIAEQSSGMNLDWFFEIYLRQPKLPRLITATNGHQLTLHWETPEHLAFPMPVEVDLGQGKHRVELPAGTAQFSIQDTKNLRIDPQRWILKEEPPAPTNAVPARR